MPSGLYSYCVEGITTRKNRPIIIALFGIIIIITLLSLSVVAIAASSSAQRIDSISAPSDLFVKFYDRGIPFDKI